MSSFFTGTVSEEGKFDANHITIRTIKKKTKVATTPIESNLS